MLCIEKPVALSSADGGREVIIALHCLSTSMAALLLVSLVLASSSLEDHKAVVVGTLYCHPSTQLLDGGVISLGLRP